MSSSLAERMQLADALLLRHFGYSAFRPLQRRVVQSILRGQDTLAVLPTGGGKSICFQIPALVLGGLTVVVSPLISLMQDQVEALTRRGIAAAALNSSLTPEAVGSIWRNLAAGALRLLYVSPERLTVLAGELRQAGIRPALLAVDEAHCISEWGHDFRPAFRQVNRAAYLLGSPPVAALTGSATPAVREDIQRSLRLRSPRCILGSFDRPNLWFGVTRVRDEAERYRALLAWCRAGKGTTIVYAPTRGLTERLTVALRERGLRAAPYHAGLDAATRERTLRRFLAGEYELVVATSAFGMGIDKPDVRLVVHWTLPPTMESYYQEAGRAGRDGQPSRCVLLYDHGDSRLPLRQLATTFPPPRLVEQLWANQPVPGVSRAVRESAERLRRELEPGNGRAEWSAVRRRKRLARDRLLAMVRYATGAGCRRRRVVRWFGETLAACAGCDHCAPDPVPDLPRAHQHWRRTLVRLMGFAK